MVQSGLREQVCNLDIDNDPNISHTLKKAIVDSYECFKKCGDFNDWQKVKLADAIWVHRQKWFNACKFALLLAFESPENISKDQDYIKHLKKAALEVDIEKLLNEFNHEVLS